MLDTMIPAADRAVTTTDNMPPLHELLAEETAELRNRAAALVAASGRAFVEDSETAQRATLLAGQIKAHLKTVDAAREARKAPFLEGGRTVDTHFGTIKKTLDDAAAKVTAMINAYLQAEKRKADAERKRLEDEARATEDAARAAALEAARTGDIEAELTAQMRASDAAGLVAQARAVERPTVVGDYGVKANLRTVWKSEVEDPKKVFAHMLKVDAAGVTAVLADMVAKQVRAGVREVPGARIWSDQAVTIR